MRVLIESCMKFADANKLDWKSGDPEANVGTRPVLIGFCQGSQSLRDQPVWLPIKQQLCSTGHVLECYIPVTKGKDAEQML
jgi:hypothetical protein